MGTENKSLSIILASADQDTALRLQEAFEPFEKQAKEWAEKAQSLIVKDASQTDLMASAREARLALKNIRVTVDKTHKVMKEESLKKGQLLDLIKRTLTGFIEPIEEHLQKQEDFVKVQEEEKAKLIFSERASKLLPYMPQEMISQMQLNGMDDQAFNNFLDGQKFAHEKRLDDARKEEEARIQREKDREAEEARIREENEKLRKANDRVNTITMLGFKWDTALEAYYHVGIDISCSRINISEWSDDKFKKFINTHSDDISKYDRKIAKKQEDEENEKKEQRRLNRAPDKDKLLAFADQIAEIKPPKVRDAEAQKIIDNAMLLLIKVEKYLDEKAENL